MVRLSRLTRSRRSLKKFRTHPHARQAPQAQAWSAGRSQSKPNGLEKQKTNPTLRGSPSRRLRLRVKRGSLRSLKKFRTHPHARQAPQAQAWSAGRSQSKPNGLEKQKTNPTLRGSPRRRLRLRVKRGSRRSLKKFRTHPHARQAPQAQAWSAGRSQSKPNGLEKQKTNPTLRGSPRRRLRLRVKRGSRRSLKKFRTHPHARQAPQAQAWSAGRSQSKPNGLEKQKTNPTLRGSPRRRLRLRVKRDSRRSLKKFHTHPHARQAPQAQAWSAGRSQSKPNGLEKQKTNPTLRGSPRRRLRLRVKRGSRRSLKKFHTHPHARQAPQAQAWSGSVV
ncbi:hypothetical protein UC8_14790 [Roseimaritima ulvae]|uniref:Uncharacterized protein n=1 Tax=Roseimaritima ulvae TaxID=980254 RepID=A0A5B9QKR5_9BACT|nr:hypothetical protein UC8_14790 [Roseimaritima ulvae]